MPEAPITWRNERRRLGDLIPWARNPRRIAAAEAGRLADSLARFGQIQAIAIGPNGEIYDGHQRQQVWLAVEDLGPDFEVDVRVASRALTEDERKRLVIYLHRGTNAEWDWPVLKADFPVADLVDWGFDQGELSWSAAGEAEEAEEDGGGEQNAPLTEPPGDVLFASDNEWGVPALDLAGQADEVRLPVALWGALTRAQHMVGTWAFYCEDYRFERLWKRPQGLIGTRCRALIEPNFTTTAQMPLARALWQTYRKRWLARWWQQFGIRIFVDLNVTARCREMNLLGVPHGWRAYATRGYAGQLDAARAEYALACEHAGRDDVLFLYYGGGAGCEALARTMGWVYVPEHMNVKAGGVMHG